ncbi:flagellar hook-length control protein FliK [Halobacillus rhizosphaerae]|uniref:flagellar hook-length control protein FliK n=1 Tax=Halobacillus rhizosphaerae TaxID=3064889 RepID=UPI00398B7D57
MGNPLTLLLSSAPHNPITGSVNHRQTQGTTNNFKNLLSHITTPSAEHDTASQVLSGDPHSFPRLLTQLKQLLDKLGLSLNGLVSGLQNETEKQKGSANETEGNTDQIVAANQEENNNGQPSSLVFKIKQLLADINNEDEKVLNQEEKHQLTEVLLEILPYFEVQEKPTIALTVSKNGIGSVNPANPVKLDQLETAPLEKKLQKLWSSFLETSNDFIQSQTGKKSEEGKINLQSLPVKDAILVKDVLKDWLKLKGNQKGDSKQVFQKIWNKVTEQGTPVQRQLFDHLVKTFQNRAALPATYHNQTPINGREVAKWMVQTIEKLDASKAESSKASRQTALSASSMPMSKIEQFTIHLNQKQPAASSQQEFIQKFERVIASSKLFTSKSGDMQLQIKLNPSNLGDMTINLTKLNGEMMVKIMVSTQAAKDMLESNIQQLRHMFSPQHVLIEKNDQPVGSQAYYTDDQQENGDFEQSQEQDSNQPEDEHTQSNQTEDLSFQEILMNEKV